MPPENFDHDKPPTPATQPASGALPCDGYHHFYHYQSSTQYLWLARLCHDLGDKAAAEDAVKKALFQDHFNEEALAIKTQGNTQGVNHTYSKHPLLDAQFCESVGRSPDNATTLHDGAVKAILEGNIAQAILHLEQAIAANPKHSNSHFWLGKCRMLEGRLEEARALVQEAIRLAHLDHEAYHRSASDIHLERARQFLHNGSLDLAINDYTKALDLNRSNVAASAELAAAEKLRRTEG